MSRLLRATASVPANLLAALVAPTLIQAPILSLLALVGTQSPVLRVQTPAGLIERSSAVNFLAACLLGYCAYRIFGPIMAKWIWVAGAIWIGIQAILLLGTHYRSVLEPWTTWVSGSLSFAWSSLTGIGCGPITDAVRYHCWQSFFYTELAVRLMAYSAGAILCSRLGHSGTFPLADAWLGRFGRLPAREREHEES